MANKIYTIGYEKRTIDQYISELTNAKVDILIDVREYAWSYKRGFCKTKLSQSLSEANIKYIHLKEAGNPKEIRRSSESIESCLKKYRRYLTKTQSGIKEISEIIGDAKRDKQTICLTCFEREHTCCHRSVITDVLQYSFNGIKILHL